MKGLQAVGVDEHVWEHAGRGRRTECATGIVDLTGGAGSRRLDVVRGRTGKVYGDWVRARVPERRSTCWSAALNPFRGYRAAPAEHLPHASVLDAFRTS
jgi:transposase